MANPLSQTYGKQRSPYEKGDFRVVLTRTIGVWPKKVFVQWILRNPKSPTGYVFQLYRSGGSNGPWTQIGTDLTDTYYYVDDLFPAPDDRRKAGLFSLRWALYYKLVVSHPTDGTSETIQMLEPTLDRRRTGIVRKLRRDAHVVLKKGSGTQVAIFKRRWWGEPCPACKTATGHSTRSHCNTCLGTSISPSYWDPIYGYAVRTSAPVENITAKEGTAERHYIRIRMEYIPAVIPKDVLVFLRDNRRYVVERIITTEIHTQTVHQELDVSELGHSAVEFHLVADPWRDPPWF